MCLRGAGPWRNLYFVELPHVALNIRCCHPPQAAWAMGFFHVPRSCWGCPWWISPHRNQGELQVMDYVPKSQQNEGSFWAQLVLSWALPEADLGVRSCRERDLIFHLPAGPGGRLWFLQEGPFLHGGPEQAFPTRALLTVVCFRRPFRIYQTNEGLVWKIPREA